MKVTINIKEERLQDLLTNALEGGSNYWYIIKSFNFPEGQTKESLGLEFTHIQLPFVDGGSITIGDIGHNEEDKLLNRWTIEQGINIMASKYPDHFADFLSENDDAITGDVFLQCALFGEVLFS